MHPDEVMRKPVEVTTTTCSLTGSIPSPSPFTFAKSDLSGSTTPSNSSTGEFFSYNSPYPLAHCVKPSTGLLSFDDLNLLCGLDSALVKDDILASLVMELGLDRMEELPELKVGHHNLSDQDVWIVRQES